MANDIPLNCILNAIRHIFCLKLNSIGLPLNGIPLNGRYVIGSNLVCRAYVVLTLPYLRPSMF